MAKKFIDIMDTTFRDGFQSIFGGRVLMNDFFPAVHAAKEAGITHFEFGGGARFQSLYFYLNEDAFSMMDQFRAIVGKEANLQTLARGVNTVMLDTGSRELIDLHAKLFKKHSTTTIRNFDALNDVDNLIYSAKRIHHYGLKHEVAVTIMDLPPGCVHAHDVAFYEKTLRDILDSDLPFDSICFKDASGTANPRKIYETIKMAKKLLPLNTRIRLHTHETAGISVASYLAALDAGVTGIDLAAAPVSGGTSQPDILTMLHATKNSNYDLGGLEIEKILVYEKELQHSLRDYFFPPEATMVSPLIPFSPMPGGALTANTQMMRDNNILHHFDDIILAMREVVQRGGYGTSVTPISQFYFQQALNNVIQGPWKVIAPGYGKMVLGYFGKTPVAPDKEIVKIASEKLSLKPTTKKAIDLADEDEKKSLKYWQEALTAKNIEASQENIFIAAACKEKGLRFLEKKGVVNIRKKSDKNTKIDDPLTKKNEIKSYTVVVNGDKFNVQVGDGDTEIALKQENKPQKSAQTNDIIAQLPGSVWKIIMLPGDKVNKGDVVMIIESMKMEIDIVSPFSGTIKSINVATNDKVIENQIVAVVE